MQKNMKALDTKLAEWLKAVVTRTGDTTSHEKRNPKIFELQRKVVNPQLGTLLDRLKDMVTEPAQEAVAPEVWLQAVQNLVGLGYIRAARTLAIGRADKLAEIELSRVAPILPDAESIEAWRKRANRLAPDLTEELLQNANTAYANATADWLLAHCKPINLTPLLRYFLAGLPRAKHLKAWDEALCGYLRKDPKANRLAATLAAAGNEPSLMANLATAVRSSSKSMLCVAANLAQLAGHREASLHGPEFLRCLFSGIHDTTGKHRRIACATLAVVGGNLLLVDKLSAAGAEMLGVVAKVGGELKNLTRSPELQNSTWTLQQLNSHEQANENDFTLKGARLWAMAFERAVQENQPVVALEVLAYNLGLREIGSVDQIVDYAPHMHEDTESGILPGEPVQVLAPGWAYQDQPVIRARVRRSQRK